MFQRIALFTIVALASLAPFFSFGQEPVHAEILIEQASIQPGEPFTAGIRLSLDENWHAYWKNPGETGMAPVIEWELPPGFTAGNVLWPAPESFISNEMVSYGYSGEVFLLTRITASKEARGIAPIKASLRWVVCDDQSCLPGDAAVSTSVPVDAKPPKINAEQQSLFSAARKKLPVHTDQVTAEAADGVITLELDGPKGVVDAEFFPEDSNRIDSVAKTLVTPTKNGSRIQVILEEADNYEGDTPIKGVVVLKGNHSDGSVAYQIDLSDSIRPSKTTVGPLTFKEGFLLALGSAFIGGLLLNLMPCVLPVISFKILSFINLAGESRSHVFKHGAAFSLGVIFSFWILAAVLLGLQAYGHAVGWGFQLQEPLFVAVLAAVILIFGLSMFGVFEMGTGLAAMAGDAQVSRKRSGLYSSFFSGVLTTAVATPCTGPFLGTAVGFAVSLPPVLAMFIFTFLGIGMASPYLLLGAFPGLIKHLPKPGDWMNTCKVIVGFVMLATVLWLIRVFGAQTDAFAVFDLLVGFLFFSIACWIYGKWGSPANTKRARRISSIAAIVFLAYGAYLLFFATTVAEDSLQHETRNDFIAMADGAKPHGRWERFRPERVAQLRKQNVPVFIDFTAEWCLTCKANHMALTAKEVEKTFDVLGVVTMKADWTKKDPMIAAELKKYGRNSVPLYVLLSSDPEAAPKILPQVLTPQLILDHLEGLKAKP